MKSKLNLLLGWVFFCVFLSTPAHSAVTAGGMAVIGYDDAADTITLVALDAIGAGEVIYLTNNGWSSSQGKFNGAAPTQGAGNESLLKLTVTSDIAVGTVLSSAIAGAGWTWEKSALIPGQVGGLATFSDIDLEWAGDQIYLFQAAENNPLLNPTNFIYALHISSPDYPTFSDANDVSNGDVPPGLSIAAGTAVAQSDPFMRGDSAGNNSSWGIDLSSAAFADLQNNSGNREQWLAAISGASNWSNAAPSVSSGSFLAVQAPEPSRAVLLLAGVTCLVLRRKRKKFQ
jgi:hypothetical protein